MYLVVELNNELPIIGVAYKNLGSILLQEINDNRSFYYLKKILATQDTAKLSVRCFKSNYLVRTLKSFLPEHTQFVDSGLILPKIPKEYVYVTEGFSLYAQKAFQLYIANESITDEKIYFKSSINDDYTTVLPNILQSLEILPNLFDKESFIQNFDNCATIMAKRRLTHFWIHHPLTSISKIRERQTIFPISDRNFHFIISSSLKKLNDIDKLLTKLYATTKYSADRLHSSVSLIAQIYKFLKIIHCISESFTGKNHISIVRKFSHETEETTKLLKLIGNLYDLEAIEDPDSNLILKSTNNERLTQLYAQVTAINKGIETHYNEVEAKIGASKLKLIKNTLGDKNFRVPITVQAPANAIVLKINKNERIFTTPTLQNFCAKLNELTEEIQEAQEDIIKKTFLLLNGFLPKFEVINDILSIFDILLTHNTTMRLLPDFDKNWVYPQLNCDGVVKLIDSRHPNLSIKSEQSFASSLCIPNSISLNSENRNLLITGANMGGKSTFTRQIMALLLLTQYGFRIPASAESNVCTFVVFYTRIGGRDNPCRGISTFMMEAAETAAMLYSFEEYKNCLYIIDELGRGTSIQDGIVVVRAILTELLRHKNVYTISATHFHEIAFDFEKLMATYKMGDPYNQNLKFKLLKGIEQDSQVVNLMRQLSYPEEIIRYLE